MSIKLEGTDSVLPLLKQSDFQMYLLRHRFRGSVFAESCFLEDTGPATACSGSSHWNAFRLEKQKRLKAVVEGGLGMPGAQAAVFFPSKAKADVGKH